jgi:hypothetical protein
MNIVYIDKKKNTDINLTMDRIYQIEEMSNRRCSLGEKTIAKFLDSNNTAYIQEHYFEDLINPNTGLLLFFDFYLPSGNLVIEVQGEFHFQPLEGSGKLKRQKILDEIKRLYCKRNKIRYVAIKSRFGKVNLKELEYGLRGKKMCLHIGYGYSIIKTKKKGSTKGSAKAKRLQKKKYRFR